MKKYKLFDAKATPRNKSEFHELYSRLMNISRTPASESGFDEWFDSLVREGIILATEVDEETMELIAHLYSLMTDEEKEGWSRQAAEDMVADQRRYEIDHGITPREYDACDFYETIAELIAQDSCEIDRENPSEDEYTPSATAGDYSPGNPWNAPGMSPSDFI